MKSPRKLKLAMREVPEELREGIAALQLLKGNNRGRNVYQLQGALKITNYHY